MYLCPRAAVAKPVRCRLAQEHLLGLGPLLRLCSPLTCPSFSSYFCSGACASRGDFIDSSLSFSYKRSHFQVECYFYHLWMIWTALVPCYFLDHTISSPLRCGPQDFDFSLTFPKRRCCGIAAAGGSRNRGGRGQGSCEMCFLSSLLQICVHIAISERLQAAGRNKIFQPGCSIPKTCLFFPNLFFFFFLIATPIVFSYSLLGKSCFDHSICLWKWLETNAFQDWR